MRTVYRTAGLVTIMLAMALGTGLIAQGQGPGHGPGHGPGMTNGPGPGHGIFRQLTEEQRDAIRQMVDQMREDGATREEIRDAVVAQLEAWGYEVPDDFGKRRPFARIMRHLTEEQRTAIKALVEQMKGDGASREEILDAVMAQLEEWGIELPDHHGGPFAHIMRQLTEEQRQQVKDLIKEMRDAGATREEIREAVVALLEEWGVELPEGDGFRHRLRQVMQELTPEQRQQVRRTIRQMRRAGASREEIRDAVIALLEEWGVELPGNGAVSERGGIRAKNYPNPFNPETSITYTLTAPATIDVQIYNMAGQLVQSYQMGYQNEGTHSVRWGGVMNGGQAAPSGIYIYRITAGDQSYSNRMLLMK